MWTPLGWVGEGSAAEQLLGTGVKPQQEAPLLVPQAIIEANFASNVIIGFEYM